MFILFETCDKCGKYVYAPLVGMKVELLYSCDCYGKNEVGRVAVSMVQQERADGYKELYKRLVRVMMAQ